MEFTLSLGVIITAISVVLSIGSSFGIAQMRISKLEHQMNLMGKRLDDEIRELKDEYIHKLLNHEKENDSTVVKLAIDIARIEERIEWMKKKKNT